MFANEYLNHEHHKDLLREAQQRRMAHEIDGASTISPTQYAGRALLALGARFAVEDAAVCYTLKTPEQVVTVCPAAC
jgi:hypothetical protein